jgi:hypothetical protein
LANEKYLIPEDNTDRTVQLAPSGTGLNLSLVYSVLVGAADAAFGPQPGMSIIEWGFTKFKIVVLSHYIILPPHHNGDLLHTLTAPPELGSGQHEQDMLRNLMRGKEINPIIDEFKSHSLFLANSLARHLLGEVNDPILRGHLVSFVNGTEEELRGTKHYLIVEPNPPDRVLPTPPNHRQP